MRFFSTNFLIPFASAFLSTSPTKLKTSAQTLIRSRSLTSQFAQPMIVGIFGGGTVGGGIATILQDRVALFEQISGRPIEIKKICVRNLSKTRDFTLPSTTELTTNYDDILNDPSIDTIIEVMGGTTDAKDIVMKAIKSGKNVVTANKALIAGE